MPNLALYYLIHLSVCICPLLLASYSGAAYILYLIIRYKKAPYLLRFGACVFWIVCCYIKNQCRCNIKMNCSTFKIINVHFFKLKFFIHKFQFNQTYSFIIIYYLKNYTTSNMNTDSSSIMILIMTMLNVVN